MLPPLRMVRAVRPFCAFFFAFCLAGCAAGGMVVGGKPRSFIHPDLAAVPSLKVAILPLENLTITPNAGQVVAQLLSTELYARHLFRQGEEEAVRKLLGGQPLEKDRRPKGMDSLQQVGGKLNVDAVLSGSVTEFSYQHGLREEPVVGVHLVMTRTKDGQVLWQASHSLRGTGVFNRETLIAVAQRAVIELVNDVLHQTSAIPPVVKR
ncbi:MAG: hypothetical protein H7839_07950 [Magnetococcus sp. YQC-5]